MKYLFLDTNIYIDMIVSRNKNHKPESYKHLKKLLDYGEIRLIIPNIIKTELFRNIEKQIDDIGEAIKSIKLKLSEQNFYWINDSDQLEQFNRGLDPIEKNINNLAQEYSLNNESYKSNYIKQFSNLFNHKNCIIINESEKIISNAMKRKLYNRKPFGDIKKDCMADSVIIETLINIKDFIDINVEDKIYFISTNSKDFSKDNKRNKDSLHIHLDQDLEEKGLKEIVKYSLYFTKTLITDLKDETESADLTAELEAELIAEVETEFEILEDDYIESERDSAGLLSFDIDYEEKISQLEEIEKLGEYLESTRDELIEKFDIYDNKKFDLYEILENIDIKSIENIIQSNPLFSIFMINSEDNVSLKDNLIEVLSSEFEYNNYEGIRREFKNDSFSINGTMLRFKDVLNNIYILNTEGYLNPSNDSEDRIYINLYKNSKLISEGCIKVYYGFINFDEDGNAGDGAIDDITIDIENLNVGLECLKKEMNKDLDNKIKILNSLIHTFSNLN